MGTDKLSAIINRPRVAVKDHWVTLQLGSMKLPHSFAAIKNTGTNTQANKFAGSKNIAPSTIGINHNAVIIRCFSKN